MLLRRGPKTEDRFTLLPLQPVSACAPPSAEAFWGAQRTRDCAAPHPRFSVRTRLHPHRLFAVCQAPAVCRQVLGASQENRGFASLRDTAPQLPASSRALSRGPLHPPAPTASLAALRDPAALEQGGHWSPGPAGGSVSRQDDMVVRGRATSSSPLGPREEARHRVRRTPAYPGPGNCPKALDA